MSNKEQPPSGTYTSNPSRRGVFLHQTTTSPPAISSPSRNDLPVERSTTGHSHTYPKSKDEQMSELVDTINTYRVELDRTRGSMEDLTRRYKDLKHLNESLESRNRILESRNEELERWNKSLEQRAHEKKEAHGSTTESLEQGRPTTKTRLAIMPFQPSQEIVQRSTIPASAQQHGDHLYNHLNQFFQQTEIWAGTYASSPVPGALQSVTTKFKERRSKVAISSHLLHDPNTLRHAITKLIVFAMIEVTFQPQCFEHFKPEFNGPLTAERRKMYGGIPSDERKALAEARTRVFETFVQDPNWAGFLNNFVSNECGKIWQLLRPVFGPGAAAAEAWPSFVGLFRQAVSIALTMHQRVCLFRVDFPPIGEKSCFNPAVMKIMGSPASEGRASAGAGPQRLRLAVTPVIYEIVWGINGAMGEPKPICKANVLLE